MENKKTCSHPVLLGDICTKCGKWPVESTESISYFNVVGDKVHKLSVSRLKAERMEAVLRQQLIERNKLSLILDIDNTLVHCMEEAEVVAMREGNYDFEFELSGQPFLGKLRPGVQDFLNKAQELFDIYLYTMGSRHYARIVAPLLHPTLFTEDKIISRDDCPDFSGKRIERLFPCDDSTVLIVDDRADIWAENGIVPPNLVKIKPYYSFINLNGSEREDATASLFKGKDLDSVWKLLKRVHSEFFNGQHIYPDVKSIIRQLALSCKTHKRTREYHQPEYVDVLKSDGVAESCAAEANTKKRKTEDFSIKSN